MASERRFDDFSKFARHYREIGSEALESISGVGSDYFSEYKIRELARHETGEKLVKTVLDFGCGDGNSAKYFFNYLPVETYHGIDVDKESIAVANERKLENCIFQSYDGVHIPYKEEYFDIIFVSVVFHHIDRSFYPSLLHELSRVLKKDGRLYIFELNPINPVTRKIVRDCPFDQDAVLVPAGYLRKLLTSDFIELRRYYTFFLPRKKPFSYLLPLEKFLYWCPLGCQYYYCCEKKDAPNCQI